MVHSDQLNILENSEFDYCEKILLNSPITKDVIDKAKNALQLIFHLLTIKESIPSRWR